MPLAPPPLHALPPPGPHLAPHRMPSFRLGRRFLQRRGPVGATVGQHGQSGLALRPFTAPEADPLVQGCPLGPKGEPSPRGCRSEAAAALWCTPAQRCSFCQPLTI
eukprot:scaffold75503_cov30-Phaeocystis_antarctica.AAC.2